jgi:membrane-associated phospholipid phosphatase
VIRLTPETAKTARLHIVGVVLVLIGIVAAFFSSVPAPPNVKPYAHFVSKQLHDGYLVLGILTLLTLAWRARSKAAALLVVAVMGVETALFGLLKGVTWYGFNAFPRPSGTDGGFPSGHTAASCALAYILTERFPKFAPLFYAIAGAVAWSRVGDGAHYAYQVLFGAILGFAVAMVITPRFREETGVRSQESGARGEGQGVGGE